ncbi:MAG: 4Fe-4S binding protein [Lentisphaerae bacterium]|jgi:NosR/NirI family transcriptional regulator, nitrous oxide reductase regulator|nr:4Fe-4S binding protein [Lentisphaerota bacterium]MBT4819819.1 4Fe-4S binding protein [Lentisphaerota bacterium]MBT5610825.1 4Fe-4S binding protein [Lentisphaerota bacterium]MBT7053743.1 4Fe-4S binding protein [Lentisphaerota bacterium]MBT7841204.1 4Fe-4S binding protein [Lentisphaerota bacterium]
MTRGTGGKRLLGFADRFERLRILSASLIFSKCVLAGGRFPKPDFDTQYVAPVVPPPLPASGLHGDGVALLVLGVSLVLTSYFALYRRSRRGVVAVGVFSVAFFGFIREGCICPVGAVQNIAAGVFLPGTVLPWTIVAFFVLPLLFALFVGRVFCAGVCPLGAVQELLVLRPVQLPRWLQSGLSVIPLTLLACAVWFAGTGTALPVCRLDPFVAFFRLSGAMSALLYGAAFLVFGAFVARPYCRFLCPYGVLLDWCSRLSWRHLSITPDECVSCRLCEGACPYGAILGTTEADVGEPRIRGVRRLRTMLLLCPLLVVVGACAGRVFAPVAARMHPTIQQAREVSVSGADENVPLRAAAFQAQGGVADELRVRAQTTVGRVRAGGLWAGAFIGLMVGLKLVGQSLRRRREIYEPDRGTCVSCGRCFASCPRERLRWGAKEDQEDGEGHCAEQGAHEDPS